MTDSRHYVTIVPSTNERESTMAECKFIGFRFTDNVSELPEDLVQRRADGIAAYVSDPVRIGATGTLENFYRDGYVRSNGYQYLADDPVRILVNDGFDNAWIVRYVPTRDPEIVNKWVSAYSGNESGATRWIFMPENVYAVSEPAC